MVLRPAQEFFHSYGDITITSESLQNLGLCSALREMKNDVSARMNSTLNTAHYLYDTSREDPG
jgi:hypothetical protein